MSKNFTDSQVEALMAVAAATNYLRRSEARIPLAYREAEAAPRSATLELQKLREERRVYQAREAQRKALEHLDQQLEVSPLHNKARRVALRSQDHEVQSFTRAH